MSSIESIVLKYQDILSENLNNVFSNNRPTLGKPGVANRLFCFHLCQNKQLFLNFLEESKLLKTDFFCEIHRTPLKFVAKKGISDGYIWSCYKQAEGKKKKCGKSKSIRHGSWFGCSKLRMEEILLLTYEFIRGAKAKDILFEYNFSTNTLANWRKFINEKTLDFVYLISEKIGGEGKDVELEKFDFLKQKLGKRSHGQSVLGGFERQSGKVFLIDVKDTSMKNVIDLLKDWIQPGTMVHTNYWTASTVLGTDECNHLTENYGLTFVDPPNGSHPDESMRKHLKSILPGRNRQVEYKFYLAFYLFQKSCEEKKVDCFNRFLELVRDIDWNESKTIQ